MKLNTVLPYQFHNVIMIFVTILTLLWCFKAMKRFYYSLRIRCAILSDRIIQIRGLSSYLSYFEGATRTHIDAVVHTRQSMPPVSMIPVNVPALIKSLSLSTTDRNLQYQIKIDVSVSVKSLIILSFDFDINNFQQMIAKLNSQQHNGSSDERYIKVLTGLSIKSLLTSEIKVKKFPFFEQNDVCQLECVYEEIDIRNTTLKIDLPNTISSLIREKTLNNIEKLDLAILIVPILSNSPTKFISSIIVKNNNHNGSDFSRSKYDELSTETIKWDTSTGLDSVETGINTEELSNVNDFNRDSGRNRYIPTDQTIEDDSVENAAVVYLNNLALPKQSSLNPQNVLSTTPTELLIIDKTFTVYNSLEIFGLSQVASSCDADDKQVTLNHSERGTNSNSVDCMNTQSSMGCTGGLFNIQEECVVCLTELKDVLLLPCRHLCVCNACLTYIDKCPVCRSNFEEYIAIQKVESSSNDVTNIHRVSSGTDSQSSISRFSVFRNIFN